MIPVRILTLFTIIIVSIIACAAADDCGCGDGPDSSPGPGDGWDSSDFSSDYTDDSSDSGNSADDSSDSENSADDAGSDTADNSGESDSTNDGESDSSSSDSGGASATGGESAEDGLLWRMKGDDLFAKGQYNQSLAAYQKAVTFDPFSFKSWQGEGKVLLALGRFDDAAKAFTKALKLDPSDAATYALLGDARSAAGEYRDAAEQYVKALAMNPKMEGITEKLSAVYAAEKLALSPGNETTVSITPAETETVTIEETTIVVPTTTKAGFPGAVLGILGIVVCLLFIGIRRK